MPGLAVLVCCDKARGQGEGDHSKRISRTVLSREVATSPMC